MVAVVAWQHSVSSRVCERGREAELGRVVIFGIYMLHFCLYSFISACVYVLVCVSASVWLLLAQAF